MSNDVEVSAWIAMAECKLATSIRSLETALGPCMEPTGSEREIGAFMKCNALILWMAATQKDEPSRTS